MVTDEYHLLERRAVYCGKGLTTYLKDVVPPFSGPNEE